MYDGNEVKIKVCSRCRRNDHENHHIPTDLSKNDDNKNKKAVSSIIKNVGYCQTQYYFISTNVYRWK